MMTLSISMTFVAIYKVLAAANVILFGVQSVATIAGHKSYTRKDWILVGAIFGGAILGLVSCLHQIAVLG